MCIQNNIYLPLEGINREFSIRALRATYFSGCGPVEADERAVSLFGFLEGMNRQYAVTVSGGKTVVLQLESAFPTGAFSGDKLQDLAPPRAIPTMMDTSSLLKLFENKRVAVFTPKERSVNLADIWLKWPDRHEFPGGMVFMPGRNPGRYLDRLNLWNGWAIGPEDPQQARDEKDCARFLNHLRYVVCANDPDAFDYLMTWLADMVQNPTYKPGTAVVLHGKKGAGKSILADVMAKIIGHRHVVRAASKNDIVGNFNGHMATAVMVNCEEVMFGGDNASNDTLKHLITGPQVLVNEKFMPAVMMPLHARFLFTTNSHYSHNTSEDERRYLFLDVRDTHCGDAQYFHDLHWELDATGGLQAFANILHTWRVPPHVNLRNPPRTAGHARLYAESLSMEERFFYIALTTGENYPEEAREEGGMVFVDDVKEAFHRYLDENGHGKSRKKADNNFVRDCMVKFWSSQPGKRQMRRGRKLVVHDVPALRHAQGWACEPVSERGLGLSPDVMEGLDNED